MGPGLRRDDSLVIRHPTTLLQAGPARETLARQGTGECMPDERAASLWNPDLAPTGPEQRNWAWYHFASLWIGMIVAVSGWMLAGGLVEQGMSAGHAALTVLLGNLIVLVPMLLIGHAG